MAGRIVEYKSFSFEVWNKSFRMTKPQFSPCVPSYNDLTNNENAIKAIEDFVSIMNIGIDIYSKKRF